MRDTIFCAIPEDADRDAIAQSIRDVVAEVQTYVPGYRLLNEPQFDDPSINSGGQATGHHVRRSGGCGRLPAALRWKPGHHDRGSDQGRRGDRQGEPFGDAPEEAKHEHRRHLLQPHVGHPDDGHVVAGRLAPQTSPVHQGRGGCDRRGAGHRGRAGHRGHPRRRARRVELQLRLLQDARAGADQARGRDRQGSQDRVPDAAGCRHQGGHQGGAEQRRLDLPDRHPLHRGRRLDPALRAGPRTRAWRPSAS